MEEAIRLALERNPEIAVLRQQAGIAAADIVIARTFPFNPTLEGNIRSASGPASAGITNPVLVDHKLYFTLELCGQGKIRRDAAGSGLSRVEWEIAQHELDLALRTVRAYQHVVYRSQKVTMLEGALALNQQTAAQVITLRELGKLLPVDSLMIHGEVMDAKAQVSPGRIALVAADHELRRLLVWGQEPLHLSGNLEAPAIVLNVEVLRQSALARRPDLKARQAALAEAEAKVRLERANRFGNPKIGPAYELNETSTSFVGIQYSMPLPALNLRKGEILKAQAEVEKVALEIRQIEIDLEQNLQGALARVQEAKKSVDNYLHQDLPALQKNMEDAEKLFRQGEPGVDVLRVLDFRRRLSKARDAYLDAQWEFHLARTDLAAVAGDPALAVVSPNQR